jgi:hypothetical protein
MTDANLTINVVVEQALVDHIETLLDYKSAADEAMSYCLETTQDERAKKLLLHALNIGAHGSPKNIDDSE